MVYLICLLLSLLSSSVFFLLYRYYFKISLSQTLVLTSVNFIIISFTIIIFFSIIRNILRKIYLKIKFDKFKDTRSMNYGDEFLNYLVKELREIIKNEKYQKSLNNELKEQLLGEEEKMRNLKIETKNKFLNLQEDYELLLSTFDEIEKMYEDLNINYNREKLKINNLFQRISEMKNKLNEPEKIINTIIDEINNSMKTVEKEKINIAKLQEEAAHLKDLFTSIKNNIVYDLSNLEQLDIISQNFKSIIMKSDNKNELQIINKELENILNSLKSIDRQEQDKLFIEYEKLNDLFYLTALKIKIFDAFEMFLSSLTNNLIALRNIILDSQQESYDNYFLKEIKEIEKVGNLLRTALGSLVNFKNDFQDLQKTIIK